jgi:positive regulator of sigma E activity
MKRAVIEEEGVVVAIEGKNARVAVLKKSACESCAAAGACHPRDTDHNVIVAANPLLADIGQRVQVKLSPYDALQKSVFIRSGIPAAALVFGAILGKNLAFYFGGEAHADNWALLSGVVCTVIAFLLIGKFVKKSEEITEEYTPVIVKLLS